MECFEPFGKGSDILLPNGFMVDNIKLDIDHDCFFQSCYSGSLLYKLVYEYGTLDRRVFEEKHVPVELYDEINKNNIDNTLYSQPQSLLNNQASFLLSTPKYEHGYLLVNRPFESFKLLVAQINNEYPLVKCTFSAFFKKYQLLAEEWDYWCLPPNLLRNNLYLRREIWTKNQVLLDGPDTSTWTPMKTTESNSLSFYKSPLRHYGHIEKMETDTSSGFESTILSTDKRYSRICSDFYFSTNYDEHNSIIWLRKINECPEYFTPYLSIGKNISTDRYIFYDMAIIDKNEGVVYIFIPGITVNRPIAYNLISATIHIARNADHFLTNSPGDVESQQNDDWNVRRHEIIHSIQKYNPNIVFLSQSSRQSRIFTCSAGNKAKRLETNHNDITNDKKNSISNNLFPPQAEGHVSSNKVAVLKLCSDIILQVHYPGIIEHVLQYAQGTIILHPFHSNIMVCTGSWLRDTLVRPLNIKSLNQPFQISGQAPSVLSVGSYSCQRHTQMAGVSDNDELDAALRSYETASEPDGKPVLRNVMSPSSICTERPLKMAHPRIFNVSVRDPKLRVQFFDWGHVAQAISVSPGDEDKTNHLIGGPVGGHVRSYSSRSCSYLFSAKNHFRANFDITWMGAVHIYSSALLQSCFESLTDTSQCADYHHEDQQTFYDNENSVETVSVHLCLHHTEQSGNSTVCGRNLLCRKITYGSDFAWTVKLTPSNYSNQNSMSSSRISATLGRQTDNEKTTENPRNSKPQNRQYRQSSFLSNQQRSADQSTQAYPASNAPKKLEVLFVLDGQTGTYGVGPDGVCEVTAKLLPSGYIQLIDCSHPAPPGAPTHAQLEGLYTADLLAVYDDTQGQPTIFFIHYFHAFCSISYLFAGVYFRNDLSYF